MQLPGRAPSGDSSIYEMFGSLLRSGPEQTPGSALQVPPNTPGSWLGYDASCEDLLSSILGLCQSVDSDSLSRISKDIANSSVASKDPIFDPGRVVAHCFQKFKRKPFSLPVSRRRIIFPPPKQDPVPLPQLPPQPFPCLRGPDPGVPQEVPEDTGAWLQRRLELRQALDSFGDPKHWLHNKASITPSEAKVLQRLRQEQQASSGDTLSVTVLGRKRSPRLPRLPIPRLQLPKPPALSALYTYLRSHKIKILEMFQRPNRTQGHHRISREEFILALNMVGVPLSPQEVEDVVIYLSSLGKHNSITMDVLTTTYKLWEFSQRRNSTSTAIEDYKAAKHRAVSPSQVRKEPSMAQPPRPPLPPPMHLLTVPEVSLEESRPMSLEEMEDVGKHNRERRRLTKLCVPSIQFSECCRLVRSGEQAVDDHLLPTTLDGPMEEQVNASRRDGFLVYLRCCRLCQAYGLQLTRAVLTRALLYPGDKIVLLKNQVRPLRQPGGYYDDMKLPRQKPRLAAAKKGNEKVPKKTKKLEFQEFEEFVGQLKTKRLAAQLRTQPNSFWPGHLLDKLRLYLPTVAPRSLVLFSRVQHLPPAYPATYHPHRWWPVRDKRYLTYGHYDAPKVYHID